MTTFAIIGAGPGLGLAAAEKFGLEGFSVALISRNMDKLNALAAKLTAQGINVRSYAADVHNIPTLTAALASAADDLGPIEILQYSPTPRSQFLLPLLETSDNDLRAALEFSVYAPVAAIGQVLPGMNLLGNGSILFVSGSSVDASNATGAGTSVAFAAEAAYGQLLHDTLSGQNIHLGHLIVPGATSSGNPAITSKVLAERLWIMHTDRGAHQMTAGEGDTGVSNTCNAHSLECN